MFNIQDLSKKLVVSCQPEANESFYNNAFVAGMSEGALIGGASGLRLNHPETITYIKQQPQFSHIPIIGIWKKEYAGSEVYITPTLADAEALYESGAEIIALDATLRSRPKENLRDIIKALKGRVCLMADISTFEEAQQAEQMGFDCVGTTLAGYTPYSKEDMPKEGPNFELIQKLSQNITVPIIAEGRISTPSEAAKALDLGASTAVVGSAITRPQVITRSFMAALKS